MDNASPEAAWRKGAMLAAEGELAEALRWLERALRLAPGDARIALDLANIRLRTSEPRQIEQAAAAFEALAARHDAADCRLGLMAAQRLLGRHAAAAGSLRDFLRRHCVPKDAGFAEVAAAVAAAAGYPGWCGVDAGGLLHIGAANWRATPQAAAHLAPAPPMVALECEGAALLGSPVDAKALLACDGVVGPENAGLTGWVSRRSAQAAPKLLLLDAAGRRRNLWPSRKLPASPEAPLSVRYGFACPPEILRDLTPPFRLFGPDRAMLPGSPVDPDAALAALRVPAARYGPAPVIVPKRAGLRIVVPVYRGLRLTQACLEAALAALPSGGGLIVVDDASPEAELATWLDGFCDRPGVTLIRFAENAGFPAAANAGLEAAAGHDVLLLNSDALLPPAALRTLLEAAYAAPETGSVTPFSNEATICSYPHAGGGNAAPDLAGAAALDRLAFGANGAETVEIPTGIGFCLLMRHDCLARTGVFRPEIFAQGYGEEVDWCLRARHRGYRHVAATGAYAAHASGASFGAAGTALKARNHGLLARLYPGFEELIGGFLTADPLRLARRRLDAARFAAGRRAAAVLLISHNHGGGVTRRIRYEIARIRAAGQRPILLRPASAAPAFPYPAELTDGEEGDTPNLRFDLPEEAPALVALLAQENISHAVLHHALGHHASMRGIAEQLGCPQDMVIHDYASFCPRVHLIGAEQRYCGEPAPAACAACVAATGDETRESLGLKRLLARSAAEFAHARRVIAPSADASRRIARHFPDIRPEVTPWEDDGRRLPLKPPRQGARRIVTIGGIGRAKGFDVLLACAEDARQRGLALQFIIAGASSDDEKLLAAGIFITGAYRPEELPALLRGLDCDLAFIPSIWPETWCFTLSEAWEAGLYTLAFDLGSQAERIAASRRGTVLPLGLPAPRVNDALLGWQA